MIAIYVRWIRSGRITLEDVPERWREDVAAVLRAITD